jgi:hypothetical protein
MADIAELAPHDTVIDFRVDRSGNHNAMSRYFVARLDEGLILTTAPAAARQP